MKIRKILLMSLIFILISCVKKSNTLNPIVTHSTFVSAGVKKYDSFLLEKNEILRRNVFILYRFNNSDAYMFIIGKMSDFWIESRRKNTSEKVTPVEKSRYHRTQETMNDLSIVLDNVKKYVPLDSIGYIVISTEDMVEIGLEVSSEIGSKEILLNSAIVASAVKKTSLQDGLNKVLKKYGMEVTNVQIMYDSIEAYWPIDSVPVKEMGLKLKYDLPSKFISLPIMMSVGRKDDKENVSTEQAYKSQS